MRKVTLSIAYSAEERAARIRAKKEAIRAELERQRLADNGAAAAALAAKRAEREDALTQTINDWIAADTDEPFEDFASAPGFSYNMFDSEFLGGIEYKMREAGYLMQPAADEYCTITIKNDT